MKESENHSVNVRAGSMMACWRNSSRKSILQRSKLRSYTSFFIKRAASSGNTRCCSGGGPVVPRATVLLTPWRQSLTLLLNVLICRLWLHFLEPCFLHVQIDALGDGTGDGRIDLFKKGVPFFQSWRRTVGSKRIVHFRLNWIELSLTIIDGIRWSSTRRS